MAWPSDLVLVRHGQSLRNVHRQQAFKAGADAYGDGLRDMDSPLTDIGRQQAIAAGQKLAGRIAFHRMFVSPYLRAFETARLIAAQLPGEVPLRLEERVRERELGLIDGLTRAGIAKKYPDEIARMDRDGRYYYRPTGGESYPDVNLRIHSFLSSIRQNFPEKPILVVTHSLAMWCFRRILERKDEQTLLADLENPDHRIDNCSILWYTLRAGKLELCEGPVNCASPHETSEGAAR